MLAGPVGIVDDGAIWLDMNVSDLLSGLSDRIKLLKIINMTTKVHRSAILLHRFEIWAALRVVTLG